MFRVLDGPPRARADVVGRSIRALFPGQRAGRCLAKPELSRACACAERCISTAGSPGDNRRALVAHWSATVRLVQKLQLEAVGFEVVTVDQENTQGTDLDSFALLVLGESSISPGTAGPGRSPSTGREARWTPFLVIGVKDSRGKTRKLARKQSFALIEPFGSTGLAAATERLLVEAGKHQEGAQQGGSNTSVRKVGHRKGARVEV